ncbi:exosortase-dependent surface protein XDP1 [Aliiglaciecola sp. SL4]|uniref:exosortase-dependent surface protein XDP1 n=1 Tax=Aliiglaciecola sp. SL4 TaxID=3239806 RepID=UPI00355B99DE
MVKKVLAGLFAMAVAGYASAGTTTYETQSWNLKSGGSWGSNSLSFTSGTVGMTVTAWSSSGNTGSCHSGPECSSSNVSYDRDPFIESAALKRYTHGLGAINNDENNSDPHHALDNYGNSSNWTDYDMVLFEFDTAVELTSVQAGWYRNDSDVSIVGYTGTDDLGSTPFSSSSKWSDLVDDGWTYQTDKHNIGTNVANISPGFESKYWLVGVYNSVFSGNAGDNYYDAIKLANITTTKSEGQTQVPEPATYALLLIGVAAIFRRKLSA